MTDDSGRWEHFDHVADMGVRGLGATKAAAFENAALALTAVVTDPASVALEREVEITCRGEDDEMLFVDWLNGIVYEMATRRMVFGEFRVELDAGGLRGVARGETVSDERHRPAVEVKGATYTALEVREDGTGRWIAQTVVDV